MNKPYKVLLNAENITDKNAIIALKLIFPYLRPCFDHIAIAGTQESLNDQFHLSFDSIYDITDKEKDFVMIIKQYDLFVTVLGFERAEKAIALGVPTVIYDPFSWFWPSIPDVAQRSLYIAQGFHSVRAKLLKKISHGIVVPPLVSLSTAEISPNNNRTIILLNLHGIENNLGNKEISLNYAHCLISAFKNAIPADVSYKIMMNHHLINEFHEAEAIVYNRENMKRILPHVKYAIQIPELDNIYDAAAYDIPTLFLPPVNTRQEQQLNLLREHSTLDTSIEWWDLLQDKKTAKNHQYVNSNYIQECLMKVNNQPSIVKLSEHIKNDFKKQDKTHHSSLVQLIDKYGQDGAMEVARIIAEYSKMLMPKNIKMQQPT